MQLINKIYNCWFSTVVRSSAMMTFTQLKVVCVESFHLMSLIRSEVLDGAEDGGDEDMVIWKIVTKNKIWTWLIWCTHFCWTWILVNQNVSNYKKLKTMIIEVSDRFDLLDPILNAQCCEFNVLLYISYNKMNIAFNVESSLTLLKKNF